MGSVENLRGGKTGRIEADQRITLNKPVALIGVSRRPEWWENRRPIRGLHRISWWLRLGSVGCLRGRETCRIEADRRNTSNRPVAL